MVYNCVLFFDQEGLIKNKQELICCQRDGLLDFLFLHISDKKHKTVFRCDMLQNITLLALERSLSRKDSTHVSL